MHLECFRPRNGQPQEDVTLRLGSVCVRPQRDVAMKHTPEGHESHEWVPAKEAHTKSLHGQKLQLLVSGLGCGGTFELIRKTHMENF